MGNIINPLRYGSVLHGGSYNYVIEKSLGQGAFGITYLAKTKIYIEGPLGRIETELKVCIKEFFMHEINGRQDSNVTSGSNSGLFYDYKRKFAREAENLSKLKHRNIVKVLESFEANNTIYYAMEYIDGGSLDDYIVKCGTINEEETLQITSQICSALSFMHQNKMLHLDLKPANIMRRTDGSVVLIDFGLSKQYRSDGEPESSTRVGLGTPGYAPIEQSNYQDGHGFPVTMDVYALGATMYKMLTGKRAPEASVILNDGFPRDAFSSLSVSSKTIDVVAKAMAPLKRERYQTVDGLIRDLTGKFDSEETIVGSISPTPPKDHVFRVGNVSFVMKLVEGGTFTMGAHKNQEAEAWDDEKPTHQVTLSSYYIGETEVTQGLWKAVMGSNPSDFQGDYLPVESVSWYDCQEFIKKLNSLTGKTFRLPTEAEWEFAARGGNKSKDYIYSGSNNLDEVAWYIGNSSDKTHPVKTKLPNELGIYDMSGNVREWCQDGYGSYCSSSQTNPTGANSGSIRVFRGGSWGDGAWRYRSSDRNHSTPDFRNYYLGLRLVLSEF